MTILKSCFKKITRANSITFIIILSFALRIFLSFQDSHPYDISTFAYWGKHIFKNGPSSFFKNIWSDYLPLPLYYLGLIHKISFLLSSSFSATLKISVSLIEVALILTITKLLENLQRNKLILLGLIASPALIYNSALWGQVDTLPTLLAALSLILLYRKKVLLSALAFGLAVGFKPIILLTLPIFIALAFRSKKPISFALISLTTFLIPAFPIVVGDIQNPLDLIIKPFLFLFNQASYQASVYPFTTINAFNFWSIKGNNWISDTEEFLGISAHTLGLALFLFFTIPILSFLKKKKPSLPDFALLASIPLLTFYTFATRMHERHLIFGLPLLLIAATKRTWLIIPYIILSLSHTINLGAALWWVNHNQTWPITTTTIQALSALNVITLLFITLSLFKISPKRIANKIAKHKKIIIILVLALLLRTVNLAHPKNMIFDEVYHAFTAQEMLANNPASWEWWNTPPEGYAYEWTHPPVSKYAMVLGMLIFGDNSFGWRIGSALVATISIALLYALTKKILQSEKVALLASFILSLEGLHLVQSRIAMNDIYMITGMLAALYFAANNKWKKSAIFFGISIATKWSAIYTIIPLAYLYWKEKKFSKPKNILNFTRYGLIAIIIYILLYTPFFLSGHTYQQFIELQKQMWYYHTGLSATHAHQSVPLQWILSLRPVWYFVDHAKSTTANIYAHSNPLVLWLGLIALGISILKHAKKLLLFLIGYFIFILPWVFSPRIMFFYHYLPSTIFLVVILAHWISNFTRRYKSITLIAIILVFLIMTPFYYGFHVPKIYWETLFTIFPSWK